MERRRARRITVSLNAERISGDKNSSIFIENISETGIHIITAPANTSKKFKPGSELNLKFKLSSGETLNLKCKVRWAYTKVPPNGMTDSVGLEVINPPPRFKQFVQSLY